ncbi:PREDICTED: exonuclease 1 isoform X1 [Nelumbo nucifera]|uniref:Exonuclease 1 n=1 Tax=Nelumbo nucifera TaxID=4432 RepID=A0A1U7Z9Z8_NELNU|nr:PREDICTED: exonuclease 1 isoform X1 [Nelumbo nucifera]
MGIQNLLRFMKPYIKPVHIKKYAGKRVGIDAYSWLHKGAYSCSMELCLDSKSNRKSLYLHYFMHRINLLRHYKITPVVVFDGGNVPCKAATEDERHRKREANLALARQKLDEGDYKAATEFFQRAVSITPLMAYQLIQVLRSENIEFVVAPYEADAQLAYLSSLGEEQGGIAAVITEDSDLMAYGCKAVIFKMDRYGNGEEIVLDSIFNSVAGAYSFTNFDKDLFTGMCVLSGCDFLPSLPGIGIKRAYSLVSKYKSLDRVLSVLKFEKGNQMPEDYFKSFKEAVAVFRHARIYDAGSKMIKPMKPLPIKLLEYLDGEMDFLGQEIPPSIATAIAEGHLNPITMQAFDHCPNAESLLDPIIIQTSDRCLGDEDQVLSKQESCFTVFSCKTPKITAEDCKPTLDESKYQNEAVALQKLIAPPKFDKKHDEIEEKSEFPDNNPFKRRKLDNVDDDQLSQSQSASAEVSEVTSVEEPDEILCTTPESQESVHSMPIKVILKKETGRTKKIFKSKTSCKSSENSQSSILNFFMRI